LLIELKVQIVFYGCEFEVVKKGSEFIFGFVSIEILHEFHFVRYVVVVRFELFCIKFVKVLLYKLLYSNSSLFRKSVELLIEFFGKFLVFLMEGIIASVRRSSRSRMRSVGLKMMP